MENKIMCSQERYLHDPVFHTLVDVIYDQLCQGNFTPSEARDAVMLACIHFEERHMTYKFIQKRDVF